LASALFEDGAMAQSPYAPVDMTPEAEERARLFEDWVAALPPYIPSAGGGGGGGDGEPLPERWNWADVDYDGVHDYVGFPRYQGGCGNCWMFASIGLIEVQYMINCCHFGDCRCSAGVPTSDCVCPSAPLDLSEQLVMECSRQGYFHDCAGSDYSAVETFLSTIGTTYEDLVPYELADLHYDLPFMKICPILDRGDPELHYLGNRVSDVLDAARAVGVPLYYYRTVGSDGGSGFRSVTSSSTDFTPLIRAIAEGHVAYANHGSHSVLIVGYERYNPSDPGDLTLLSRDSHGNMDVSPNPAGENGFGLTVAVVDAVEMYAPDAGTGYPQTWLYNETDSDGDGTMNVFDSCIYSEDGAFDPGSGIHLRSEEDGDDDMWPEDETTASGDIIPGCDMCPGIPAAEMAVEREDGDGDGIADVCDGCPDDSGKAYTYLSCVGDGEGDHVCDECDNCSSDPNAGQENTDGDALGDVCDACPHGDLSGNPLEITLGSCLSDLDGDGRCDDPACDNCPEDINVDQWDTDHDGIGNICDGCPFVHGDDSLAYYASPNSPYPSDPLPAGYGSWARCLSNPDGDNHCNDPSCDNCPSLANDGDGYGFQGNYDGDSAGDACDGCPHNVNINTMPDWTNDQDLDGLIDACDLCRSDNPTGSSNPMDNAVDDRYLTGNQNSDGDSFGDRCDMCPNDATRSFGDDSDNDGLMDDCDLCRNSNPTGTSDPIANAVDDYTLYGSFFDADKDHVGWRCDNCLDTPNRDQFDSDEENWSPGASPAGDACDTSPAIRFWSLEENAGECGGGVLPSAPRAFIEERGPSIMLKLAYTGMVASMPNTLISMPVKNAFCDCEQYQTYDECDIQRDCGNDNHNVANPGIDTGSGWLFLLKKRGEGLMRGDVGKSFTRLYSGEELSSPCPEFPFRSVDWGCFPEDSVEWYKRTPVGDTNINGDEFLVDSPYGHEMQRFEWAWYEETEIKTNTNPPCEDDSCSANYRIYLHPFSDSNEVNEDAFFHPVSGVATVHAECPPADGDGGSPWPDPIPVPVTEPPLDLPCQEQWECRNIIPGIFTIDHPEIPDVWRYDSHPTDSAVGGLVVAAVDPYRGRIAGFYLSSFEEPADVIDTIDFSAALDAVAPQHDVLPAAGADLASGVWIFGGRNLMGCRNDLWHGVPVQDPQSPGGIAYHWTRHSFSQNQAAPSPRGKAALFMDPGSGRLVLFGGKSGGGAADGRETIFSDLWFFDTAGLSWSQGRPWGDIPAGLKDFSVTQGTIRMGGQERPFGFLWGGMNANGAFSNDFYMLDLQSGEFHSYSFESGAPPGMTGAALRFDPTSRSIHLFGGFDGQGWHNWLWTFEFQDVAWFLEEEDCFEGTCPHPAATPVLISYDANDKMIVFPGPDLSTTYTVNPEPYFVRSIAGWEASSLREPWMIKGDCDGNGEAEVGWGSRCSTTGLWFHLPGKMTCDTLTRSMLCMQDPLPAVDLYSHRMPGLKVLRAAGDVIFAAKGAHLVSLDGQDPSSLQELDAMVLGGEVRDMELWKGKLIIARDAGLAVVDAGDPSSLVLEREIWTCGKASAVEVTGDTAWFLTPSGVGSVDLEDEGAAVPSSFGLLLPVSWQDWEIIDVDGSFCGDHSFIADEYSWGPERKFEAAFGWGYAAVQNDLIVIRLDDEGLRVESSLRFDSRIEALRLEDNYVYLVLKDGSRPLVNVRDPADPRIAGEHGVADWTAGATGVDGRTCRMTRNFIEIAEAR
jgi:hypothetical protein